MISCNHNASVTLRYALYELQLAHAVGQCILQPGGSDALFPNDLGGLVLHMWTTVDVF